MLADLLDCLRKGYFHYKEPITLSELTEIANDTKSHYRQFYINKKNGGKRLICAPSDRLKEIQDCIKLLLSGLYFRGVAITNCASKHIGKEIVYNIDIKDFYPSINAAQISLKLLSKGYKYDVAQLLSLLVTTRSKNGTPILPQGAPTSPIIADLVVEHLEARLWGFANKHNINISRYVDDITFSCSKSQPWHIYFGFFKKIIETEGFIVNEKKCHVSFSNQRQEVLGLTVNSKVNVSQKYIKQLRTILHNWEKDGYIKANNLFLMHYFKGLVNSKTHIPKLEKNVAGKLSFLKMVRNANNKDTTNDPVWVKLHDKYVALIERDFFIINGHSRPEKKRYGNYEDSSSDYPF